jgi:hypothetical protein
MIRAQYTIQPPEGSAAAPISVYEVEAEGVWIEQEGDRVFLDHEDMVRELIRALQLPAEV